MPSPRVFVSSTCYDLAAVRERMRGFIKSVGFEPVLSEYSDVLYDPRTGTHESCIREVENVDMVVLIVGSRFGGTALPEALSAVDMEELQKSSFDVSVLSDPSRLSVTQIEVLKAVELSIPVFAFVDGGVLHDRQVYLKNKHLSDQLNFPNIDKGETATFIFDFITFLNNRVTGNSVVPFSSVEGIEGHLLKQWSALFQRLLREQRENQESQRQFISISEQMDDLKSALISTIDAPDGRQAAKGVLRYRRLIDFLYGLEVSDPAVLVNSDTQFGALLSSAGIEYLVQLEGRSSVRRNLAAMLPKEGTGFYELRYPLSFLHRLSIDWHSFCQLKKKERQIVLDAVVENSDRRFLSARKIEEPFEEFYSERYVDKKLEHLNRVPVEEFFATRDDDEGLEVE